MSKVFVYSVAPIPLSKDNHPLNPPRIPKCDSKRGFTAAEVQDRDEGVYVPGSMDLGGSPQYNIVTTSAEDIAKWLAEEFSDWGVFYAETPSQKDEDNARAKLAAHLKRQYDIADSLYARTRNRMAISDEARVAARYFGLTPEWAQAEEIAIEVPCKICGEKVKSTALKCRHCGEILDKVKYAAATSGEPVGAKKN